MRSLRWHQTPQERSRRASADSVALAGPVVVVVAHAGVEGTLASVAVERLGKRVGVGIIHPHAFRHACAVELLKRPGGNLRAVQEHLRHADIQTTTIYTRLAPQDLQKVVNLFDEKNGGGAR